MWDVLVITDRTILANRPDIILHFKKEKTCLLTDINVPDDLHAHTKETKKLSMYKDLEIGQEDVESKNKNCGSYNWSIRNNQEGITSEPSVAPRSLVTHRATQDHTEHCTHHLCGAGVNHFDILLRSGLTSRLQANK